MTRPTKPKKKPSGPSGKHLHAGVLVRAPDAEREAWALAAEAVGMTRLEWIRHILNGAARKASKSLDRLLGPSKKDRAKKG